MKQIIFFSGVLSIGLASWTQAQEAKTPVSIQIEGLFNKYQLTIPAKMDGKTFFYAEGRTHRGSNLNG